MTGAVEPGQFGGGEELANPIGPFAGEQRVVFRPKHRGGYRDPVAWVGSPLRQRGGDRPGTARYQAIEAANAPGGP